MAFADETADMAADCDAQLGRSVTLEIDTPGSLNTTTGRRTPASTASYTVSAVRSRTSPSPSGQGKGVDLRIVYTVQAAALSALSIAAADVNRVVDAGETWPVTHTAARGNLAAVDLFCARKARA
ncbi:MAG: hypothetical protein EBZ59_07200 [Planctomycetia bacterium]|nr:hypothetical protein [Planctomycetia bacterium]